MLCCGRKEGKCPCPPPYIVFRDDRKKWNAQKEAHKIWEKVVKHGKTLRDGKTDHAFTRDFGSARGPNPSRISEMVRVRRTFIRPIANRPPALTIDHKFARAPINVNCIHVQIFPLPKFSQSVCTSMSTVKSRLSSKC